MFTIERITHHEKPIYHSTYTSRPPEGCSYRVACMSMKKQYPGHTKRVMFGVWSFLRQHSGVKKNHAGRLT